ncbi:MAG: HD domain-containing protein [Planctomycetes bacterium]|nr:HD domain-containing protein [Planctomycetota bacterium]
MRPHILLVEDVDTVRVALASMLAPRYAVTTARDGDEALDVLRAKGGLAVVVTDYRMPGRDGVELLRCIHHEWPETVGIVLSGELDLRLAVKSAEDERVFRLLSKPCSFETLSQAIDGALEQYRVLDARAADEERRRFEHDALASFNGLLEERSDRNLRALVRLNRLAVDLHAATTLRSIAEHAVRAVHELLDGRGVLVQLYAHREQDSVEASAGAEMSARLELMPITDGGRAMGEITVDVSRCLAQGEALLLEAIAASTGVAAQNELRRWERDHAHQSLILALASLSEARDHETGRHLERVAEYCNLIAEGLRDDGVERDTLTDAWIADLVRASALHDIGKVGVPDSILLKPGRLSMEEWFVMKRHAELGARTLERVMVEAGPHGLLVLGRDIAWCHHERWDGSGYPRGLAGAAIPLAARIMALADVYDALTTIRPYKRAWEHGEAVAWITERSGTHFDPEVAQSFLRREDRADAIRRRLADVDASGAAGERGEQAEWAA